MTPFVQASAALTESLFDDPFYWAITEDFGDDLAARKHALSLYFHYSLEEAERTGRCVLAPDPRARGRSLVTAAVSPCRCDGVLREV